jgi:hypothetical protein
MANPEMRCASTKLEVPDFHVEIEGSARAVRICVDRSQRSNAVRVLMYAADQLAHGGFASIEDALDFVLDGAI